MSPIAGLPGKRFEEQEVGAPLSLHDPEVLGSSPVSLSVRGLRRNLDNGAVVDLEVGEPWDLAGAFRGLLEQQRRKKIRINATDIPLVGSTGDTLGDLIEDGQWKGGSIKPGSAPESVLQGQIHGSKFIDDSIPESKYETDSVNQAAVGAGAVGEPELGAQAVDGIHVLDEAITRPKLHDDLEALFDGFVKPTSSSIFFQAEGDGGELITIEPGQTIEDYTRFDPVQEARWYCNMGAAYSENVITDDGFLKITPRVSTLPSSSLVLADTPSPQSGRFTLFYKIPKEKLDTNPIIRDPFPVPNFRRTPMQGILSVCCEVRTIVPRGELPGIRMGLGPSNIFPAVPPSPHGSLIFSKGRWTELIAPRRAIGGSNGFIYDSSKTVPAPFGNPLLSRVGFWFVIACNLRLRPGVTCLEIGNISARFCGLLPDEEYTFMQTPAAYTPTGSA